MSSVGDLQIMTVTIDIVITPKNIDMVIFETFYGLIDRPEIIFVAVQIIRKLKRLLADMEPTVFEPG